jgi:hypothetical protein
VKSNFAVSLAKPPPRLGTYGEPIHSKKGRIPRKNPPIMPSSCEIDPPAPASAPNQAFHAKSNLPAPEVRAPGGERGKLPTHGCGASSWWRCNAGSRRCGASSRRRAVVHAAGHLGERGEREDEEDAEGVGVPLRTPGHPGNSTTCFSLIFLAAATLTHGARGAHARHQAAARRFPKRSGAHNNTTARPGGGRGKGSPLISKASKSTTSLQCMPCFSACISPDVYYWYGCS